MTSWLTRERQWVADVLTDAGIPATPHVPARPNPPVAMVLPGNPYIEPGDTFDTRRLHLVVQIVVGSADNAAVTVALDGYVATALDALDAALVNVEQVGGAFPWRPKAGGEFLVVPIDISYIPTLNPNTTN